jgi:hypothetical protein
MRTRNSSHPLLVQKPEPTQKPPHATLPTEKDVRHRIQLRRHREILVYGLDAPLAGVVWRSELHPLSLEDDLARVWRKDASYDVDQGGLAGTVVSDEGNDFARTHLEVHALESLYRSERLVDRPSTQ